MGRRYPGDADDEIERQIGLLVGMGRAAAGVRDDVVGGARARGAVAVDIRKEPGGDSAQHGIGARRFRARIGRIAADTHHMAVDRVLDLAQGHLGRAARLAKRARRQAGALALVHRRSAGQIGQTKGVLSVAAIGHAEQREQRRVLDNIQQLTLAEPPASRLEGSGEHPDLAKEGSSAYRHDLLLAGGPGLGLSTEAGPSRLTR